MHFSIDRIVHTTAFDKPVVDHWLPVGSLYTNTATGITNYCLPVFAGDG